MDHLSQLPGRSTRVIVNLAQLRRNFDLFLKEKPAGLKFLSVVKDNGYGHGMVQIAMEALKKGASYLGVVTVDEALELREAGITAPILLFGERTAEEMGICFEKNLTCSINSKEAFTLAKKLSSQRNQKLTIHLKINTGMNRYGLDWSECLEVVNAAACCDTLFLEGIYSHFAMSDELDKSFAQLQIERFQSVLNQITNQGIHIPLRHICNSGGYLDLPQAHFDMVRIGILPLGVYPSSVCRRVPGLAPVMELHSRIAALREIQPGEFVGYGLRYQAQTPRKIAVLPIGYGDGFPRVRNEGSAIVRSHRAPVVGGIAMDAMMVDVTDIPGISVGDEVVLVGKSNGEEISIHDLAALRKSVSYDAMTSIRSRIPRVYSSET
ncbi:MAG: Alanine racemase [Verrucomicrobiales bacterium]|nr:Alanine racemase [Verrucomicrobiales bacterium]